MESSAAVSEFPSAHQCCPRCTRWAIYARDIANRMQLRDWLMDLEHEPHDAPGALAVVRIAEGRRIFSIALHRDWDDFDPDMQRHALVHELVHPLLALLHEAVASGARDEFGGSAYRVFMGSVDRELERATDVLASVIAPSMPMPPADRTSSLSP